MKSAIDEHRSIKKYETLYHKCKNLLLSNFDYISIKSKIVILLPDKTFLWKSKTENIYKFVEI
jgi:hypothetical protein